MSAAKDGGPAFARAASEDPARYGDNQEFYPPYDGMSLRDYFAIDSLKATAHIPWRDLDYKPVDGKSIMENMALCAYQMADAMLAAREAA